MGKSKSSPPPPAPQPTFQQVPVEVKPIERKATSGEARDRAQSNPSAQLLTSTQQDAQYDQNKASMLG